MSTQIKLTPTQRANRVRWVQDLLSGEYVQGRGALRVRANDGAIHHCCLGVAGERLCPASRHMKIPDGDFRSYNYGTLPRAAARALGLGDFVDLGSDQDQAVAWNDGREYSFEQIADRIAWATERGLRFADVLRSEPVPTNYARTWLATEVGESD